MTCQQSLLLLAALTTSFSMSAAARAGGHGGGAGHLAAGGFRGCHGGYGHFCGHGYPGFYGWGYGLGFGLGYGLGYGYGYGYPYGYYGGYPAYGAPIYVYTAPYVVSAPPCPTAAPTAPAAPGTPAQPNPTATPETAPPPMKLTDGDVLLNVRVPPDAAVWINGSPTTQTGPRREFISSGLAPGKSYSYEVRARWTIADGTVVDRKRRISVQGGERRFVDFALTPLPSTGADAVQQVGTPHP